MSNNPAAALESLDDAIASVEEARGHLSSHPVYTGGVDPGSHGLFGRPLDELRVLRGQVADNAEEPPTYPL